MKKIFIPLFVFCTTFIYGQKGNCKPEDAQAVKDRTLIVVVEEPNLDLLNKLDDKQKAFYTKDISDYNDMMKQLMPKYWSYGSKVEFKTTSEVAALVKSKSKDYAYLEHTKFTVNYYGKSSLNATMNLQNTGGGANPVGGDYMETAVCVRLTDANPLGLPVWSAYLPSPFPTAGQMVYGLKQMQLHLKYRADGKSDLDINKLYKDDAKNLPKMTLLIDKSACNLSADEIKKYYPFPFRLVDATVIDSAFQGQASGVAAILFIPRVNNQVTTQVIETNIGTEVGRTDNNRNTGVSMSLGGLDSLTKESTKGTVRKDDLKILAGEAR